MVTAGGAGEASARADVQIHLDDEMAIKLMAEFDTRIPFKQHDEDGSGVCTMTSRGNTDSS